jgi:hypothetical protein
MAPGGNTVCIVDGVRRAKAWQLAGAATVRAVVLYPDGKTGPEQDVSIDWLRSPKSGIDMSPARQADRFWRVIQSGLGGRLPAILISPGSQGTLVKDVGWIY